MSKERDKLKIAIVDTYYRDFLKDVEAHRPLDSHSATYQDNLQWLLAKSFGTFDAYSRGLTACGWETLDIIANCNWLQELWRAERKKPSLENITHMQIMDFNPNVIFCQDLNVFNQSQRAAYKEDYYLAGQCSCAWPGDHVVEQYDILFTSFPHYVKRFEALGVKAVFLPLAFDPEVHHRLTAAGVQQGERNFDVSFCGGMSRQFGERARNLEWIVNRLADFKIKATFCGYGNPNRSGIDELWALAMYQLYGQSKIVLNIHHPAAEGYSNNLRMFEATGMGALLLTEDSPNIQDYFRPGEECWTYRSPEDAVEQIRYLLERPAEITRIAGLGQRKTLTSHTYFNRMPIVARELEALIA